MTKHAREPFAFGNEDGSITVVQDDVDYDDKHPYVKAYPGMFDDPVTVKPPKETGPKDAPTT